MNAMKKYYANANAYAFDSAYALKTALGESLRAHKNSMEQFRKDSAKKKNEPFHTVYGKLYVREFEKAKEMGTALFKVCLQESDGDMEYARYKYKIWTE